MPTPPLTIKAPVEVSVDKVLLLITKESMKGLVKISEKYINAHYCNFEET